MKILPKICEKYFILVLFKSIVIRYSLVSAEPQLNLPPLPSVEPTIRPNVYPNSYTPNQVGGSGRNQDPNNPDNDRSTRFGPPYGPISDLEADDRPSDYKAGSSRDDSFQYNFNNGRQYQSPFSNRSVSTTENYPPSSTYSPDIYNRQSPYDNRNPYNNNNNNNNNPFNNNPDAYNQSQYYNQNPYNRDPNRYTTERPNIPNQFQNERPNAEFDPRNFNPNDARFNDPRNLNPNDPRLNDPRNLNPNDPRFNDPRFNNDPRYINDEQYRLEQDRRYAREMEKLRNFLIENDRRGSLECTANVAAQWNYETDVNEITQTEALLAQQKYSDYMRGVFELARNIDPNLIFDQNLARQYRILTQVGPNALPPDQLDRYNRLINDMLVLYNGASICAYEQPFHCGLKLNPDLKFIMAKSRDWDELQHTWTEFHRKAGRNMRDSFEQLMELMNEVGFANNLTGGGEYWFSAFESGSFRQDIDRVWDQIKPLYDLLHAYVRRKLREFYGPDKINRNAPLPSHIFGNMYAQSWTNILDIIIPYPGRAFIDVTPKMIEQGYNPLVMFQLAEEFFLSMNMSAMPKDFWLNSVIQPLPDRQVLCQPSAWDFCNRRDYRIKMCTKIKQKDFISVHHEMAHIQYFLNYRHQPKVFRDGANPGFHEAIGEAIGLSVGSLKHFQTLGLIQKSVIDFPYDINYLFAMAIDKVAFLPYALSLEAWRYDVFSRRINREMLNCHFWNLREQYGGIKPPVLRSELDFDPGAKYHVPANVPYMKYFVGTVLQFQIYRAMCLASRQYVPSDPRKPLHKCDVYRQPDAGNLLKRLMEKGSSESWQTILAEVIGEGRLDGSALRDYFRPLEEWLRSENLRNQEYVGWNYDGDYCKRSIETANLQVFGGFYNRVDVNQINAILLLFTLLAALCI